MVRQEWGGGRQPKVKPKNVKGGSNTNCPTSDLIGENDNSFYLRVKFFVFLLALLVLLNHRHTPTLSHIYIYIYEGRLKSSVAD